MPAYGAYFWKKAPFTRLLFPLIAGIIVQWHFQLAPAAWWLFLIVGIFTIAGFFFIPFFNHFRLSFLTGIAVCIIFLSLGALLVWYKDIRHRENWVGHLYKKEITFLVSLDEPLTEKPRSFKANATVF